MPCLGTAIPAFKGVGSDLVSAVGTAVAWIEGSALITIADVILTNIFQRSSER